MESSEGLQEWLAEFKSIRGFLTNPDHDHWSILGDPDLSFVLNSKRCGSKHIVELFCSFLDEKLPQNTPNKITNKAYKTFQKLFSGDALSDDEVQDIQKHVVTAVEHYDVASIHLLFQQIARILSRTEKYYEKYFSDRIELSTIFAELEKFYDRRAQVEDAEEKILGYLKEASGHDNRYQYETPHLMPKSTKEMHTKHYKLKEEHLSLEEQQELYKELEKAKDSIRDLVKSLNDVRKIYRRIDREAARIAAENVWKRRILAWGFFIAVATLIFTAMTFLEGKI